MKQGRWRRVWTLGLIGLYLTGCGAQAPYMRGWQLAPKQTHRWIDGEIKPGKLSEHEAAVYAESGTPDAIRFFRTVHTRQRTYEWIYEQRDQIVWFVDGNRVDYVAVDTKTSGISKQTREAVQQKLVTGGILSGLVGGIAAGTLLFGQTLGLKD